LRAEVELMHFGAQALVAARPEWRVIDVAGKVWLSGALPVRDVGRGKNIALGRVDAALAALPAPAAYRLEVALAGTAVRNDWPFWLYPTAPALASPAPAGVLVTASWDAARAALAVGATVLLLSGNPATPAPDLALTRTPIFWNRLMNPKRTWMVGLLVDAGHRALAGYPSEAHCDWQWVELLGNTTAMNIESLPRTLAPIVLPIDDWNRNLRLAMLFECAVGKGKLLVSAFDLSERGVAGKGAAAALRKSVLEHMGAPGYAPAVAIAADALDAWVAARHSAPVLLLSPPATGDVDG
jgi:hypothetical protein